MIIVGSCLGRKNMVRIEELENEQLEMNNDQ